MVFSRLPSSLLFVAFTIPLALAQTCFTEANPSGLSADEYQQVGNMACQNENSTALKQFEYGTVNASCLSSSGPRKQISACSVRIA